MNTPLKSYSRGKRIEIVLVLVGLGTVLVWGQPAITRDPQSQSVSLGANVTFSVSATSLDLVMRYQWNRNNIELPGATNRTLVVTNVLVSDAGSYSVRVGNVSGSVTSKPALLDVDPTFTRITSGPVITGTGQVWACAWSDYDLDGFDDLFVSGDGSIALLHNEAGIGFSKVGSDKFPLGGATNPWGGAWGDFNNDGWPDLFIPNNGQKSLLLVNDGDGTFTRTLLEPLTSDIGTPTTCAWGDYDNDGWLDLFLTNRDRKNFLYHADGMGGFARVTTGPIPNSVGHSDSCSWGDFNNDGIPDLFLTQPNRLFQGGENGGFTDVTKESGVEIAPAAGDGTGWADYDNDGFLDLAVCNIDGVSHLYRNQGNGTFEHITNTVVSLDKAGAFACAWADFDNDGDIDLFIASHSDRNRLYQNNGDGTFAKITRGSIVNDPGNGGGACAWADVDNNGFPDLFAGKTTITGAGTGRNYFFYGNDNGNRWLKFKLVGTQSNRSALGVKVRVRATLHGKSVWQMREISSGDGLDGNSQIAAFGLADAEKADEIRIEWPSGIVQEFRHLPAKQMLTVVEPPRLLYGNQAFQVKGGRFLQYRIEGSANLAQWTPITTLSVTNLDRTAVFADTNSASFGHRFYRAVSP